MTTTTIDHRPITVAHSLVRFALVVVFGLALMVGAFAVGRASAPERTLKPIVSTHSTSDSSCGVGRAC